jgi:hypothetical protein
MLSSYHRIGSDNERHNCPFFSAKYLWLGCRGVAKPTTPEMASSRLRFAQPEPVAAGRLATRR